MTPDGPVRILRMIARLNIGGPAIQAVTLSKDLSPDRYETLLLCGRVGPFEGDMSYLAEEKGVAPVFLPELGREISPWKDFLGLLKVREQIKKFHPHIIHTHTAKAGFLGRLAALSVNLGRRADQRILTVHTFHGHVFHGYFSPRKTRLFIRIERFLAKHTDRIIAISPQQKTDLCDQYRIVEQEKVMVLPLGFDLSPFKGHSTARRVGSSADAAPLSQNVFVLGIIGRLTPIKNHVMLFKALGHLSDQGRLGGLRVAVIGDGELRAQLEGEARRLAPQDAIVFEGWRKNMPRVYEALDGVVLTSVNEGTPVTVIEAMASARPVIATHVGGVGDLLGPIRETDPSGFHLTERGILVPPGHSQALAAAILYVKKNRETMAEAALRARGFVLRRYSMERLLKDMDLLYNNFFNRKWRRGGLHSEIVNKGSNPW